MARGIEAEDKEGNIINISIGDALSQVSTSDVIDEIGQNNVLDEIGMEAIIKYFGEEELFVATCAGQERLAIKNMDTDGLLNEMREQDIINHFDAEDLFKIVADAALVVKHINLEDIIKEAGIPNILASIAVEDVMEDLYKTVDRIDLMRIAVELVARGYRKTDPSP